MRHRLRIAAQAAILSLVVATEPALAQSSNPFGGVDPLGGRMDGALKKKVNEKLLESLVLERAEKDASASSSATVPRKRTARVVKKPRPQPFAFPIEATDFRGSGLRMLPDALADSTEGISDEDRDALRAIFHQTLQTYESSARPNNVATAMAFLLAASLQVVTGQEMADSDAEKITRDLNDALASAPEYKALGAQDKQALYEAFVLTGGYILLLDQLGVQGNDPSMRRQAHELASSMVTSLTGN